MVRTRLGRFAFPILLAAFLLSLSAACAGSGIGRPSSPVDAGRAPDSNSREVDKPATSPGQTEKEDAIPAGGPRVFSASVTRVVDGDTVYVRLGSGREERVRLIGVDTPESTKEVEPYGKEAAAYTKQRLSGRTVYL